MATSEQWAAIQKALGTQLGGDTYSKVSMLSPSEIETVLKDTNTKNQTDALNSAQSNLNSLSAPYQQFAAANISAGNTYNQQLQSAAETTGYKQAQSSYDAIIQKGPMFELAMRPELAKVSPTFMGANPKDLDAKLTAEGITDPFTKQSMIQNYMQYADKSMTMSLSSLGQLYDSAVIAARTATEDKQKEYQKVADMYKEAYSATIMANKDWLESKINPSGGTGTNDNAFWSLIDRSKNELQQGEPWGNVWNRIKAQYPNIPDSKIDNALGTSWREGGAFQEFKKEGSLSTQKDVRLQELLMKSGNGENIDSLSDEEAAELMGLL